MHRSQYYPEIETTAGKAVMDYGTILTDLSGDYNAIANSSAFSYQDKNRNGRYDAYEPVGPFPVAASFSLGEGKVTVVADPSMAINALYGLEGNAAFIASLAGGRTAYLDTSHWSPTVFSTAKSSVTVALSAFYVPELRYLFALAGAVAIMGVGWSRGNRINGERREIDDHGEELERAAEEHPDWDRAVLERLAEERRRGARVE